MSSSYHKFDNLLKIICDESRLTILEQLQNDEKCACQLLDTLDIGQSTLSHHMKILCDSGIVQSYKKGKWTHYFIRQENMGIIKDFLDIVSKLEANLK